MSDLLSRITIEDGKRSGRPCIHGMRIAVHDVLGWAGLGWAGLGWLAAGMSEAESLADYDELEPDDLRAALLYAARELDHPVVVAA